MSSSNQIALEEIKARHEFAIKTAKEAGKIIMEYYGHDQQKKQVTHKSEINLVTAADKASEEHITAQIRSAFPQDGILAEEASEDGDSVASQNGLTWVIDPLDGTTSFAHTFPCFAVSIALVDQNNEPLAGAVYAPCLDELYEAYQGAGARLNGSTISVSGVNDLSRALLGTGFPYNRREIMDRVLKRLGDFLYRVHDIRRTGAAAVDLCFVAAGRLDGYYEEGLHAWDVAAGVCILREAGGRVSLYDGSPFNIFTPEIIATNKEIHEAMIDVF